MPGPVRATPPPSLDAAAEHLLAQGRVGHLGTADAAGQPLVLPCCYAWDGRALYSAIDAKPKRGAPRALRRLRNIAENPRVSVVIDHWDEDWRRLRWVLIQGRADILTAGPEYERAADLLLDKYPQYRQMGLAREQGLMIRVTPARISHWSGG
jgi:PPOX class probable F420-dependent enzyme